MSNNLLVTATEHYAYGWYSPGALMSPGPERPLDRPIFQVGSMLFRTDAEARGYDMTLFDKQRGDQPGIGVSGVYR